MKNKSVAIIGAGWLGLPLAQHLQAQGAQVMVTATSAEKTAQLAKRGLNSVCYQASANSMRRDDDQAAKKIFSCQVVIICIPPKIRHGLTNYPELIKDIVVNAEAPGSQVQQLILCSSTAVYNGLSGEVDETCQLNLSTDKTAILAAAEQQVLTSKVSKSQVVRLGGLIGPERHPGRFFSEDRLITNPESPINFVHRDDVIAALAYLIKHQHTLAAATVNVVAPGHPQRRQFYQRAHAVLERNPPQFSVQQDIDGKLVKPTVLLDQGFQFHHPDLLAWLENSG
ncbi:NAD(P)-binding domain-containing protein [Thalassotalea mangrovi]|nr:NAD(P)-binding domain-containing protein [Thalassotalea mangrovi]